MELNLAIYWENLTVVNYDFSSVPSLVYQKAMHLLNLVMCLDKWMEGSLGLCWEINSACY